MKKRTITGFFIVLVVAIAVACKFIPLTIGDYIFDVFLLCIALISAQEISNIMQNLNKPVNKMLTFFYPVFNYAITLIALRFGNIGLVVLTQIIGLPIYFLIVLLAEIACNKSSFSSKAKTSLNTLFACLYPSFLFCSFLIINHCDNFFNINHISVMFVVLVIAITFLTDTFAYFVGSLLHGPKLAPKISPNKTISGAIGGLIGGVAAAMIVFAIIKNVNSFSVLLTNYNLHWWNFLIIGGLCAVIGQIGDLFESYLKRKAQIKDSGNLLPGHGGMLDRVDAMTFNVFYTLIVVIIIL